MKIGIITPWFGNFAGGAERLARSMARELVKRGISTTIFTTCSASPYHSWWQDHFQPGVCSVDDLETHRFATGKVREPYDAVIKKISRGKSISPRDEQDFFAFGINSPDLVIAVGEYLRRGYELLALPYFHGLTHSVLHAYPQQISLIPCFHDEPQFYWGMTETLLRNAKHIFFNSFEEKQLAIKMYGRRIGRRLVESVVTGVGVEPVTTDTSPPAFELPDNYFVYAGRKERGKNVHLTCEWFLDYVKRFHTKTKFVLIGGGDKTLVPQTEHFLDLGLIDEQQKHLVMKRAKAIVNLSVNESFSIVLMEGWIAGTPCVVSADCAITRGHVNRCNGGLFVSNSEEFGLALNYLENNETARRMLAANGARYVQREFSFDSVLTKYLSELGYAASAHHTVNDKTQPELQLAVS